LSYKLLFCFIIIHTITLVSVSSPYSLVEIQRVLSTVEKGFPP